MKKNKLPMFLLALGAAHRVRGLLVGTVPGGFLESLVGEHLLVDPLLKVPQRQFHEVHLQQLLRRERHRLRLNFGLYLSLCHGRRNFFY